MRKSFISRALAVGVLAPAVVSVAVAQPVHAAVGRTASLAGTCGTTRDTTGSCSTTNTNVTVSFPACGNHYASCQPVNVQASSTSNYPKGLTVLVPHWGNSRESIHTGDRVKLSVNAQGLVAFSVVTSRGVARTRFAPVVMIAPRGGYRYLWVLTKTHSWQRVGGWKRIAGGYTVTQPGVYKWTRS
jgi:hypothetical protein